MTNINEKTSNNIKNIASRITITNTINQLKKFDLFDEFKSDMETIAIETSKPQIEWNDCELNCERIEYHPDYYERFHDACQEGYYNDKEDEYKEELARLSLQTASENTVPFNSFYCDSYFSDYQMSGLDFGVIKWNPYMSLRGAYEFDGYNEDDSTAYYEYLDEVTDISFSCFHGMTPQQILDILNEVK